MANEYKWLRMHPCFDPSENKQLEEASLLWSVRTLKKDQTLWWQGQPADELALILSGKLSVHIADEEIVIGTTLIANDGQRRFHM